MKTVVVLGNARSGTSMLSGILKKVLGVDMDAIENPNVHNLKGDFESYTAHGINNDIFSMVHDGVQGGELHWMPPEHDAIMAQKDKVDDRIRKFVEEKSKGKELWGWKNPKTSLTIDLYMPYLENPYFIIIFRNPYKVAESTVRATNGAVDMDTALKVNNFYNEAIMDFMKRYPEAQGEVLVYEDIMSNPIKEVEKIAKLLEIDYTEEKRRATKEFVIPEEDKMRLDKEPEMIVGGHRRATFLVAIPNLGMVPIEFVLGFARLQMPMNCLTESFIVKGMEVGVARNYSAERLMQMKPRPEYLFFYGDDMIANWDSLLILYEEMKTGKWDILSALYYMKSEPPHPVMGRKDTGGALQPHVDYVPGQPIDVDLCGLDFCLIKSEVFEKISGPPWFKTGPDMKDNKYISVFTEDVFFCDKVLEAGLRIGVHTGCKVGHLYYKTGEIF